MRKQDFYLFIFIKKESWTHIVELICLNQEKLKLGVEIWKWGAQSNLICNFSFSSVAEKWKETIIYVWIELYIWFTVKICAIPPWRKGILKQESGKYSILKKQIQMFNWEVVWSTLLILSAPIFLDASSSPSIPFCTWSKAILSKEVTMSCNNKERNVGFWVYCWSFVTIPIVPHFPHLFSAPSLWPFEARTGEPKLSIASCKSSEERIAVVVH